MSPERSAGAAGTRPGRVLVTGWFSVVHGEATAGDLLAQQTVCQWLGDAGLPFDVSMSPVLGGPSPDDVDPGDYSHLLFVCGPAAGWQVEELLDRFAHCRKIAVGVSVVESTPEAFDEVLSRDGVADRPDLSLGARREAGPPLVAVVRSHPQEEYPDARHDDVHRLIDDTLRDLDLAVVEVDTRVDPRNVVGRRPQDVEAALARVDAVVTTRLHGMVLALRHGVPAVAVDPVPGGAKVSHQAGVLGWPAALTVEELSGDRLCEALAWALGPEAARRAAAAAGQAGPVLDKTREELLALLTG